MIVDEGLAQRIRSVLGKRPELVEKKMFGGVGFMLNGNMVCGIHKEYLIVRFGSERYSEAITLPHTKAFDMTGKPMTGWIMVAPEGYADTRDLTDWIQQGVDYVSTLPPK